MGRRNFRTKETHERYLLERAKREQEWQNGECPLCTAESVAEFTHWRIIPNAFPYDAIADRHDMLIPIAHGDETALSEEVWEEYRELKQGYINEQYDFICEGVPKTKSIPAHFHFHLLVAKGGV